MDVKNSEIESSKLNVLHHFPYSGPQHGFKRLICHSSLYTCAITVNFVLYVGQMAGGVFHVEFGINDTILTRALENKQYSAAETIIRENTNPSYLDEGQDNLNNYTNRD